MSKWKNVNDKLDVKKRMFNGKKIEDEEDD